MNEQELLLANKYAQAFLNVAALTYDDFNNMCEAQKFFVQQRKRLFFLKIPGLSDTVKCDVLRSVLDLFQLGDLLVPLIKLLVAHKRAFLIDTVAQQLCVLYRKCNKIEFFTITSSHMLTAQELEVIKQFLVKSLRRAIIYEYHVDKKLIAGIRLQSDACLWEYSVRKQLASLNLPLIH